MILLQGVVQELHDGAECVLVELTRHILRLGPAPLCGVNKLRHLQQPLGLHGHKHILYIEVGHLVGRRVDLGEGEPAGRLVEGLGLGGEAGAAQASVANVCRAADASLLTLNQLFCL